MRWRQSGTRGAWRHEVRHAVSGEVLAQTNEIPADATVLVVAGPKTDLLEQELPLLRDYLSKSKAMLFPSGDQLAEGEVVGFETPANRAVGVFVGAALPGAVRVAEVDRHPGPLGDLGVPRHLPALVVSHALAHLQRHAIERGAEAFQRRSRRRVVHLHQHQVATGSLHQRAYTRGVGFALDQVAFPMLCLWVFMLGIAAVQRNYGMTTVKALSVCSVALAVLVVLPVVIAPA